MPSAADGVNWKRKAVRMKRIIAVDDDPLILQVYVRMLGAEGYAVQTATDPEKGLQLIKAQPPDLVILDVEMPGMTGLTLFEEFKRTLREIPVLFATGYPDSFNKATPQSVAIWQRDFADGSVDIIYKPFESDRLLGKVLGLIGAAQEE